MFESSLFRMLIVVLILILMSNAVSTRQEKSVVFGRTVIKSLLFVTYLVWDYLYLNPLEKGIGIYGGLFHVTTFTQTFNIFILLISATILTLNAFYPRKINFADFSSLSQYYKLSYDKEILNTNAQQFSIIEYPLIIVFILCGALFLISTNDLVSVFLSIELQSYGLYILSTIYRDSEYATASGLTYFLLGGLSSCFILLGSALLYVNSGTTNLENIYVISSLSEMSAPFSTFPILPIWYQPYYLYISLIIISVGFLFKVSAAPFHFWSPDVYDGIPTVVTTYVAIVAKISIFAFLLEFVHYTEYSLYGFNWKTILILSSLFSLIIGSVLGLTQFRIKRLLAYSTINNVGFILLALAINSTESIQAYIFYILQYTLSNLNAFMILITIGYTFYNFTYSTPSLALSPGDGKLERELGEEKNTGKGSKYVSYNGNKDGLEDRVNSPIQLISQIKGYFYSNPFIAISLAITLFSFAGVPPLVGFFGKQMILSAALDSGHVFMALVAILTSVISAAYYLNLIKEIFFFPATPLLTTQGKGVGTSSALPSPLLLRKGGTDKAKNIYVDNISLASSLPSIISAITLLIILFIYIPEEWFHIVVVLSLITFK